MNNTYLELTCLITYGVKQEHYFICEASCVTDLLMQFAEHEKDNAVVLLDNDTLREGLDRMDVVTAVKWFNAIHDESSRIDAIYTDLHPIV